ncbi:hypothetical protein BGZ57DRAFT_96804 [Hyaloscypha finlandica]|nr:hypothetical protein BGZ57DRAFT_96804 [Hyaloscypha finlandica]
MQSGGKKSWRKFVTTFCSLLPCFLRVNLTLTSSCGIRFSLPSNVFIGIGAVPHFRITTCDAVMSQIYNCGSNSRADTDMPVTCTPTPSRKLPDWPR